MQAAVAVPSAEMTTAVMMVCLCVCMYVTFVCVPVCMFVCMYAVVAVPSAEEVYDAVLLVMCRAATRMSSFVNVANIGS